ncbi:MAG: YceI family protein [Bacteroidota bacterium]
MRFLIILLLFFRASTLSAAQIIVFVDESKPLDKDFLKTYYPEIQGIAKALDIELLKLDISKGAPVEITVTPQLIFQNEFGRSFYVGRYSELSRFKVFLRTVARNPQTEKSNFKNDILTYHQGRSTTALPVKVTQVSGSYAGDQADFRNRALAAFNKGFKKFSIEPQLDFKRTDRLFYLDIYPFISEEEKLYLSYEIFSQFNCVVPVYSRLTDPLVGEVSQFEAMFQKLAAIFENEVLKMSKEATNGDGFSIVSNSTASVSWEDLGLGEIKTINNLSVEKIKAADLIDTWVVASTIDKLTPMVQFNFYAPLDSYAGEVKNLNGTLKWKAKELSGSFMVNTKDVTMGEETYDKNVHKKYIKVKRFPEASFVFESFSITPATLLSGETDTYLIPGTFYFMGKSRNVTAATQIVPVKTASGTIQLVISSAFDLNIFEHSQVNGPDGPKEARENMQFKLNFTMTSK